MPKKKPVEAWRNSIIRYADEDPASLLANPGNWRTHPREQTAALVGSLNEVGWIAPVIVNETTQHVVDGHARIGEAIARGEPTVPVAYVELTEEQERLALATFDPIAAMAGTDQQMLDDLLAGLATGEAGLQAVLDGLGPPNDPTVEWQDMPAFENEDQSAVRQIVISFVRLEDVDAFARLIERKITPETKSVWYPRPPERDHSGVYVAGDDSQAT